MKTYSITFVNHLVQKQLTKQGSSMVQQPTVIALTDPKFWWPKEFKKDISNTDHIPIYIITTATPQKLTLRFIIWYDRCV